MVPNHYAALVTLTNFMSFLSNAFLPYLKHYSAYIPGSLIRHVASADFVANQSLSQQEEVFILQYFSLIDDNYKFHRMAQVDM